MEHEDKQVVVYVHDEVTQCNTEHVDDESVQRFAIDGPGSTTLQELSKALEVSSQFV